MYEPTIEEVIHGLEQEIKDLKNKRNNKFMFPPKEDRIKKIEQEIQDLKTEMKKEAINE